MIRLTSAMIFFHSLQINCEPPPDPPNGMIEATVVVSFKNISSRADKNLSITLHVICKINVYELSLLFLLHVNYLGKCWTIYQWISVLPTDLRWRCNSNWFPSPGDHTASCPRCHSCASTGCTTCVQCAMLVSSEKGQSPGGRTWMDKRDQSDGAFKIAAWKLV